MKAVGGKTVKAKENLILESRIKREDLEKMTSVPDLESALQFFTDEFNVALDLDKLRQEANKNMKSIGT
jgi:hypothetical protein